MSWLHNRLSSLAPITREDGSIFWGVVIAFTGNVLFFDPESDPGKTPPWIDPDHVYQLLVSKMDENNLRCRCEWPGAVIPVQPINDDADGRITEAKEIPGPRAPAAAFLIGGGTESDIIQNLQKIQKTDLPELWVRLRGDFVIEDTAERRAIDAEFVHAELPTGDRPKGSDHGIQGGLFESWFTVVARRVDINRATPEELEALPGIGRELAGDIITGRPFSTIDELLKVPGIGTATMKKLRPLVTIG